jgi:hypothetical protein
MRECYDSSIAPVVAKRWAEECRKETAILERTKELKAGFRALVARELFAALPLNEQKAFGETAKKEAVEARAVYMSSLNSPPATIPDACGQYVDKGFFGEIHILTRKSQMYCQSG